ncbi:MAG: hypothetical protein JWQ87_5480 [Candidatus Sulfotelmatobacter sp.]|nr:hypothetical protein [Candidatus Sulfotelmatobacter sp.]
MVTIHDAMIAVWICWGITALTAGAIGFALGRWSSR